MLVGEVKGSLAEKKLLLSGESILDATIIQMLSFTKGWDNLCDPEMSSIKKCSEWPLA